ncbi:TPA: Very-long-chain, variant 2 [Trebouxia sp. C0004]
MLSASIRPGDLACSSRLFKLSARKEPGGTLVLLVCETKIWTVCPAGLVRGSPLTALMQWSGRSNVLFAILHRIPQLWTNPAAAVLIYVWALSEVVRYPWYATSLLKCCPSWLTWLRYTLFIPLYPVGMLAEMVLMVKALPFLKSQKLNSVSLPNVFNFGFDYHMFIQGLLFVYPFLWLFLYQTLLHQRKKKVQSGKRD